MAVNIYSQTFIKCPTAGCTGKLTNEVLLPHLERESLSHDNVLQARTSYLFRFNHLKTEVTKNYKILTFCSLNEFVDKAWDFRSTSGRRDICLDLRKNLKEIISSLYQKYVVDKNSRIKTSGKKLDDIKTVVKVFL